MFITANIDHVLCNGEDSGSIDIDVNGGVDPYDYNWNSGQTSDDLFDCLGEFMI